ncbi:MAG TPA: 2-hydroxychromene-2-carboxylate isomerase [Parvibaculum sp.]
MTSRVPCRPQSRAVRQQRKQNMSQSIEFFFDFRSPYSYLAYSQLPALGAEIVLRPMNVISVMKIVGNTPTTVTCKAKGVYANADLARWAKKYGLPMKPANIRSVDGEACLRALLAAASADAAVATTKALFNACWGTGRTLTSSGEVVEYLAEVGVDTKGLADRIDGQAAIDALEANCKEAAERGVFGAPTIMIGDVMFFGNDRLDFVREHLTAARAA